MRVVPLAICEQTRILRHEIGTIVQVAFGTAASDTVFSHR
jgi:hypothetical protein